MRLYDDEYFLNVWDNDDTVTIDGYNTITLHHSFAGNLYFVEGTKYYVLDKTHTLYTQTGDAFSVTYTVNGKPYYTVPIFYNGIETGLNVYQLTIANGATINFATEKSNAENAFSNISKNYFTGL